MIEEQAAMRVQSVSGPTHIGFSDESQYNEGRFRSVALVSSQLSDARQWHKDIGRLLEESAVREFKWNELRGARERFAASKLLSFAVCSAQQGQLRVDVLIWDIEDSRHKGVKGRDDQANLQRMYFHLHLNVLQNRWAADTTWKLHPDINGAVHWEEVHTFLASKRHTKLKETDAPLFHEDATFADLQLSGRLVELRPMDSKETPLLQLADLFAGMGAYSWNNYDAYAEWCSLRGCSPVLAGLCEKATKPFTKAQNERFFTLEEFSGLCKNKKLGVSLHSSKGLQTKNPNRPINFWRYEPQHEMDKAPTKRRRQPS